MSAQVIHIREFPKTEREQRYESLYLDMLARISEDYERKLRRLKARLKRRKA